MAESRGIIYSAYGEKYVGLAVQSARSLREICPDLQIDLFSDRDVENGVFDRVVRIDNVWSRSRLDVLSMTRFDRTVCIDVDTLIIANIEDLFDVLDYFEIAFTHDHNRNSLSSTTIFRKPFPNSLPQLNGGLIVYRKSPRVEEFFRKWASLVREHGIGKDQPALREAIIEGELKFFVLPPEYNFWDVRSVDRLTQLQTAPRIIHSNVISKSGVAPIGSDRVAYYFGNYRALRIKLLISSDRTIPGKVSVHAWTPGDHFHLFVLALLDGFRRLRVWSVRKFRPKNVKVR